MTGLPAVPTIFWIAVATTVALVFWATVIGRYLSGLLPNRLRPVARFYLAPAFGLAFLTVSASIVGRWIPLGDGVAAALLSILPVGWVVLREPFRRRMVVHAACNSLVALAAGVSMLAPLLVFGAFNAHNDAFTYLAHSGWLQDHAFAEIIEPGNVTPLTTQIAMYQHFGFRMGGSFLLALVQSVFGLQWAYSAYPAVIIAAMFSSCLALGFPLAPFLARIERRKRLLLLCLPAFGFGGSVFAANYGFLPQTVGMTSACSLLFLSGPVLRWASSRGNVASLFNAALLSALLLSAATFAYSEFVPFVVLTMAIVALFTMVQSGRWWPVIAYGLSVMAMSLLLLNQEILRAYSALKLQSGAVVGTPVDWSLLGFVAHALGIHGGAWDIFQWTLPGAGWASYGGGLLMIALLAALAAYSAGKMMRAARMPDLLPITTMLVILSLGLLYFRYWVPSPFPVGTGQSWSQFKLADWAHPFFSVLILLALLLPLSRLRTHSANALTALCVVALLGSGAAAVERVRPVLKTYGHVRDLAHFYREFRQAVLASCAPGAPVYLSFGDRDQKFRQIATLYLPDRQVLADWHGDDYVNAFLPEREKRRELAVGHCIAERLLPEQVSSDGLNVGPFTVGLMPRGGRIRIASVEGAHEMETNGRDWWRWIEGQAVFNLQSFLVNDATARTHVTFTYATRGPQTITLVLEAGEGTERRELASVAIKSSGEAPAVFDEVLDVSPTDIQRLRISTNGVATPLQAPDTRSASWRIQNLHVEAKL
ncbi:hypothetical protein AAIH46_09670 [Rhizobium sp. 0TCS1.26]|uniref:hypothetical protein n=1 Tax=Rhizobium sp. 0TCS1.26 TaxID=3142623 RepID=UPI003D2746ED